MKLRNARRLASNILRSNKRFADPFVFLPVAVGALKESKVSCPFCSVKLISRAGLIAGLCPSCFEERCAKCGAEILLENGEIADGLTVGRGGSWKCAKCARRRTR
jgi:hypothetical protein